MTMVTLLARARRFGAVLTRSVIRSNCRWRSRRGLLLQAIEDRRDFLQFGMNVLDCGSRQFGQLQRPQQDIAMLAHAYLALFHGHRHSWNRASHSRVVLDAPDDRQDLRADHDFTG